MQRHLISKYSKLSRISKLFRISTVTFFAFSTFIIASALDLSAANAYNLPSTSRNQRRPGPTDPAHLGPLGLQLSFTTKPLGPTKPLGTLSVQTLNSEIQNPETISPVEKKLKPLTDAGARALTWLNLVNKNRAPENKLVLADRNTKNPVPPNAPNINSIKLMLQSFQRRVASLPPEMKKILIETDPPTEATLVSDELFIKHIREINSSYQNAVRWIGQQPWLNYYEQNAQYDIRGLYFINRDDNFQNDLQNFMNLSPERKKLLTQWLLSLCLNRTADRESCRTEFSTVTTAVAANNFYEKYLSSAQQTYANFFTLNDVRKELKWNPQRTLITQDFILPAIESIASWLKSNVEEEWKALNFQLLVNYVPKDLTTPYIDFKPGVTPNVSGPTWNKITMDPNYSLDDFSTQWTIRHEFGHVLGFPDCYLEFYEPASEEMIYYTIEPENLMCAWGGVLQPSHIEELKRIY